MATKHARSHSLRPATGSAAAVARGSAALMESVLSDFADFVDKQQHLHQYSHGKVKEATAVVEAGEAATKDTDVGKKKAALEEFVEHDELSILDQLGLSDDT